MNAFKYKKLLLAVCMACGVLACSESNEAADAAVEIQAHLNLAEVYKNQGQFRASIIEATNAYNLMPRDIDTVAFIAGLYLEIGDVNHAIEQLQAGLAADPGNVRLKLLLGEAYLNANRIREGVDLVRDLQVPADQQIQRDWLLGNLLASSGDTAGARALFEANLEKTENSHVPTLIALSKVNYLEGDFPAANQLAEQATAIAAPDDEDLWIWRGQLAMLQEDYPAAESAFLEALDIMSLQDIMTAKRYGTLQSVLVPLQMQQKNTEALRYSQIIASSPQGEFTSAYTNVLSLFQQGDTTEAKSALDDLLATAPNNPASNILLGISRYTEGNFQEAERLLSEYVDASTASSQMILTLATTHLRMNQPAKALAVLEEALKNNPDDPSLTAMVGVVQRGLGRVDESIATLSRALETSPDSKELRLALAGSQTLSGAYDEAIENLRGVIASDPASTEAKSALLDVYVRQQDFATARATVRDWIAQDDSTYNNMAAALVEMRADDLGAGRRHLERVLALEPDNVPAQLFLARVDLAEAKYNEAIGRFESVLEIQPANADAMAGILVAGDMSGSPDAGIAKVRQMTAPAPNEYLPALVLSQYYLTRNNLDPALEHAETAFEAGENSYTRSNLLAVSQRLAMASIQQNDLDKARAVMARSAEVDPDGVETRTILAGIEAKAGNYAEAQKHIDALRAQFPDQPFALELEGDLARAKSDMAAALSAYRKAWEMEPTSGVGVKIYQMLNLQKLAPQATEFLDQWLDTGTNDVAPRLLMAMELQGRGQDTEAVEFYEQVHAIDPNNLVMLNNLAWLYQDSRPERALELAGRGAQLYPQNADVLDTYGWVLHKQDNKQQAIAVLEQAAQLAPDNASIREHLELARQ